MSCSSTAQLRSPGSERCQDLHSHTAEPETRPSSAIPTLIPDQGASCCPGVWQEGTEQASVMPLGPWAFLTSSPTGVTRRAPGICRVSLLEASVSDAGAGSCLWVPTGCPRPQSACQGDCPCADPHLPSLQRTSTHPEGHPLHSFLCSPQPLGGVALGAEQWL